MSDASDDATLRISDFGLCALLRDTPAAAVSQEEDAAKESAAGEASPRARSGSDGSGVGGEDGEADSAIEGGAPATALLRRGTAPVAAPAAAPPPATRKAQVSRRDMVGTPEFMAPEVVMCAEATASGYSFPCDVWSCGCVVFALLTGLERGPFGAAAARTRKERGERRLADTFEEILSGRAPLELIGDYLARDLLTHMLALKPELRYTPSDALTHPWLVEVRWPLSSRRPLGYGI